MTRSLHPNAHRVSDTLIARGHHGLIVQQPETVHTAEQAAAAVGVEVGAIVKSLVFLLDDEGGQADRRIDPGDPIAILQDPDCVLEDVPNKFIVQADNVLINFGEEDAPGFPAPGEAEADLDRDHE